MKKKTKTTSKSPRARRGRAEVPVRRYAQPDVSATAPDDGSIRGQEVLEAPRVDAEGKVTAVENIARHVTTSRQTEEILRLQSAALESAANGIVLTDRDGVVLWVNPAFSRMTQYAPEEIIGRKPSLLKSGRHDDAFYRDLWATILRGGVWHGEVVNRRKDGSLYLEEMTITPVLDDRSEISHFIAIKQDITERVQAEQALRASQAQLQTVFDSLEEGLVVCTLDGQLLNWNPAALKMHGFSNLKQGRRRLSEFTNIFELRTMDGAVLPLDQWPLSRILRGEAVHDLELCVQRCHSTWQRLFDYAGSLVRDVDGQSVLAVVRISDITERKRTEAALRESEERFRLMVNTATDYSIYMVDANGHVTSWNAGAERITGYEPKEIIGRHLATFYTPEDVAHGQPQRDLKAVLVQGHMEREIWRVRKDSTHYRAQMTATLLRDDRGRIRGVAFIDQDLTERRELEQAVSTATEVEKNRVASDLHDGIGPQLTGMRYLMEGLQCDLMPEQPALAQRAGELSRHLQDIFVQIRHIVQGLRVLPSVPDSLLKALRELAIQTTRESRIACRFHCNTAVCIENTNVAAHLYRIAQEAVHNAVKHSQASRICIGLHLLDQSLVIVVRDNGLGFHGQTGKGLGQQTIRHRANQIGGEVMMRNRPRGGLEVVCSVPLAVVQATGGAGS